MKKAKLLSLLLCASTLALAGCNGGNEGSSSSHASGLSTSSTSTPTTTPTSSSEPVGPSWSDEIKAHMLSKLDGTILPFVDGTWVEDATGSTYTLKSSNVTAASYSAALVGAKYVTEYEATSASFYSIRSASNKGRVTVAVITSTGDYPLQVQALFEEEPEQYWSFLAKQLMSVYARTYLPYVDGDWVASYYTDRYSQTYFMGYATTLTIGEVANKFIEDGYLVNLETEKDPTSGEDKVTEATFSSLNAVDSVPDYASGWIFNDYVYDTEGNIQKDGDGNPIVATYIQAYYASDENCQVTRFIKGEVTNAPFGLHKGDHVEVEITFGNYYSAADFENADFSVSPAEAVGNPTITSTGGNAFYVECEVLADAGTEIELTVSLIKGQLEASGSTSVSVVSDDVKLAWTAHEAYLFDEYFGGELPFLGPTWTIDLNGDDDLVITSTDKTSIATAEELLAEDLLKYEYKVSDTETVNLYVYDSVKVDGILLLGFSETEEGASLDIVNMQFNYAQWGTDDLKAMHGALGEDITLPIFKGAYAPWSVNVNNGKLMTYGFNVSVIEYAKVLMDDGYDVDQDVSGEGYYLFSKQINEQKFVYVELYDYPNYNQTPLRIYAYVSYTSFPVDDVMAYLRAELGETYETTLVTTLPGVPQDVTYTFFWGGGGDVIITFSRDLTSEEKSAVLTGYKDALYAAGWHEYDEDFTDSPDSLFYVYTGFYADNKLNIYFAFN